MRHPHEKIDPRTLSLGMILGLAFIVVVMAVISGMSGG